MLKIISTVEYGVGDEYSWMEPLPEKVGLKLIFER